MNNQSPEFLQAELNRYKKQLSALSNSLDYEQHLESRATLRIFYQEKITELEKRIEASGINQIEVIDVEIVSEETTNHSSTKKDL